MADPKYADPSYKEAVIEELCERLASGKSLIKVCAAEDMPSARTVQSWMAADDEFASQITRAREAGYHLLADQALEDAEHCEDPGKGRLLLDARRWYLGKLSNAFSDDKTRKHELAGPNGGPIAVSKVEWAVVDPTTDE